MTVTPPATAQRIAERSSGTVESSDQASRTPRSLHLSAHMSVRQAVRNGSLTARDESTRLGVTLGLLEHYPPRRLQRIARRASRLLCFFDALWGTPDRAFECSFEQAGRAFDVTGLKGTIIATAHFGAYRWLTLELLRHGVPVTLLVDAPFQQQLELDVQTRVRAMYPAWATQDFATVNSADATALWQLVRALKRGRSVITFIDGNSGMEGKAAADGALELSFLARRVRVRPGIAALSQAAEVPIVPLFSRVAPRQRAIFDVEAPILRAPEETRKAYRERCMKELFSKLEREILARPGQWEEWWLLPHWLAPDCELPIRRRPRPEFQLSLPGLVRTQLALPDGAIWVRSDGKVLDLGSGHSDSPQSGSSQNIPADPCLPSLLQAAECGAAARDWLEAQPRPEAARLCLEREVRSGRVLLQRNRHATHP
ncbi:MAG TPA: hypothetical protein VFQ61_17100 [Polyangiaceae bacterium]|nr:hypothetical protein [Polyangiaceae bacterium]